MKKLMQMAVLITGLSAMLAACNSNRSENNESMDSVSADTGDSTNLYSGPDTSGTLVDTSSLTDSAEVSSGQQ